MNEESNWDTLADHEKVRLLRANDEWSHTELLKRLFGAANHALKGSLKSDDNIHDVAMLSYTYIVQSLQRADGGFRFEAKWSTYCMQIVTRKAIDLARKLKREREDAFPDDLPTTEQFDQLRANKKVICRRVWGAWQEVKKETRKARDLKIWMQLDIKGEKPQEVATYWKIERNHVNVIATRIRAKLQTSLVAKGFSTVEHLWSL